MDAYSFFQDLHLRDLSNHPFVMCLTHNGVCVGSASKKFFAEQPVLICNNRMDAVGKK